MGLKPGDLKDLIYRIFEIDSYKSKMGPDSDIIVICFSVMNKEAGEDLVNFVEKGYDFVLDSDVTPGEQKDGTYKVFVELERDSHSAENIMELMDGIQKLSDQTNFKFRYYKSFESHDTTLENIKNIVPSDPREYKSVIDESKLNNYKNFFNRSYVDDVHMLENILTIKKIYADPLKFRFLDFGEKTETLERLSESVNVNDFAEIIFLSKYIGDYNITKYGNKITLENKDQLLVLERV